MSAALTTSFTNIAATQALADAAYNWVSLAQMDADITSLKNLTDISLPAIASFYSAARGLIGTSP
jgi:hypothetical protein